MSDICSHGISPACFDSRLLHHVITYYLLVIYIVPDSIEKIRLHQDSFIYIYIYITKDLFALFIFKCFYISIADKLIISFYVTLKSTSFFDFLA